MTEIPEVCRKEARRRVAAVCRRLGREYGPVEPPQQRAVLDALIGTILSQNTSDANSGQAFDELVRRFGDWHAVRRARVATIARAIRRAGLANRKAPRIKAILQQVYEERGELSLEFLAERPTPQAVAYLRALPGVGPKTAACVLLFACRKPVLPVDTHVHRVGRRLGLIGPRTAADKAHDELAGLVPPGRVLEFHVQLVRHGRRRCAARKPGCEECPLLELCPEGPRRLQAGQR
jgi:endonuclease-3